MPAAAPVTRSPDIGDELFVRKCDPEASSTPSSEADTGSPPSILGGETVGTEAIETTTEVIGPTVPWHLLLTSAAPAKGRILGIFT